MRRLLLVLALLVVVPTAPAVAYDPCAPGYPDPAVTLRQSAYDVKPGERIWLGGRLSRNGCGIAGKVGLFVRERPGAFRWVETTATNSRGEYTFGRVPRSSFDAMVLFSGTSSYRRAISQVHHVGVSTTRDRDEPSFTGCDNEVQLPPRWTPPEGWRLELLGVPPRIRTGDSVKVTFRVTNDTDRTINFSTQYNGGSHFVLLQNVRSGERPNGVGSTDMNLVRGNVLEPGQSTTVPGRLQALHCFYPRIHAGSMRTVSWLITGLRDEEKNITQTVYWYAPPVAVEVVP